MFKEGWAVIAPGGAVLAQGIAGQMIAVRRARMALTVEAHPSIMLILISEGQLVECMSWDRGRIG